MSEPRRPWVYIASPYTKGDQACNVRFQLRMWDALHDIGAVPIAPLWNHFQHLHNPRPERAWIQYDNELIRRCDACLRLSAVDEATGYVQHESAGADAEARLFLELNKPVFFDFYSLKLWIDAA